MDIHPHQNGTSTAEQVQNREELRQVLADVRTLPETQRTALLLREVDQLSYEEIAQAMDTTIPSIKSLLVRARIGLAESSKARLLTCGEVQVELAEAAEGIAKASGPARKHVRSCERCREFRDQLRSDRKALAALFPLGPFALIKGGVLSKIFGGGAAGSSAAGTAGSVAGSSAAGGFSIISSAIGIKAAAGMATAALLTAGAVEVRNLGGTGDPDPANRETQAATSTPAAVHPSPPAASMDFTAAPVGPARAGHDARPEPANSPPAASDPANGQDRPAGVDAQSVPPEEALPAEAPPEDPGTASIGGVGEVPTTGGSGQDPGSAPATPTETVPVETGPPPSVPPPATPVPPVVVAPVPVSPSAPTAPATAPTPEDPPETPQEADPGV